MSKQQVDHATKQMVTTTDCFPGTIYILERRQDIKFTCPVHFRPYFCTIQFLVLDSADCSKKCGFTVHEISLAKKVDGDGNLVMQPMQYFSKQSMTDTVPRIYTERPSRNKSLGDYRNAITPAVV